ncbi:P-loop containing nucleoside triphosphate hydrolase protein [Suillus clintonianus]|uniref:P-loop containing nucleoside triphosphate hydrolase protein n=1 Tax=Suillus clintonianus TaxID=1904413 RepID=UPI001B884BDD|nr:P-loop containing nucleoside triphosphate hydrolase protein [Suillus clintonianus]KAG2119457.1 P-loop containing nucleoside triphosphate hydrolase protein [Suillus clintonianus]
MLGNVVIIGQSGAGKSSLINMLCPTAKASISNNTYGCTMVVTKYTCHLGGQDYCQVHDTVGLEEGRWGFLPDKQAQKQLKSYMNGKLKKSPRELDLVVYCIPGARGSKKSQARNFKKYKSLADAGHVQVIVVVTHLEGSAGPLEDWWSENAKTLKDMGIPETTKHACVVTLPKHELESRKRHLYDQSYEAVKALIRNNLPSTRRR